MVDMLFIMNRLTGHRGSLTGRARGKRRRGGRGRGYECSGKHRARLQKVRCGRERGNRAAGTLLRNVPARCKDYGPDGAGWMCRPSRACVISGIRRRWGPHKFCAKQPDPDGGASNRSNAGPASLPAGCSERLTTRKIKRPGGKAPPPGHVVKRASGGGFSRFPLLVRGEGESQWQPRDVRSFPLHQFWPNTGIPLALAAVARRRSKVARTLRDRCASSR
jgi:hypothetical protein